MLKLLAKTAPNWPEAFRYLESIGFTHRGFVTGPCSVDTHYAGWLPSSDGKVEWHVVMMEDVLGGDDSFRGERCVRLVYGSPCALPGEHPVQPFGVSLSPTMEQWVKAHCLSESEGIGIGPVLGFVSGSPVHPDSAVEVDVDDWTQWFRSPVAQALQLAISTLETSSTPVDRAAAKVLADILAQRGCENLGNPRLTDVISDAVYG